MKPVLYCMVADQDKEAAYRSWRRQAGLDLEVVVDRRRRVW